jgi:Iron-binding zinc finger CDGSH type
MLDLQRPPQVPSQAFDVLDRHSHQPFRYTIRFQEIAVGRRYRPGDSPQSGPTGESFAVEHCPSGSYTYALEDDRPEIELDLPVSISVTSAEERLAGPLWITGGIPLTRADGEAFETRNRVTLCRCGHSKTKPLCDGTHLEIEFRDGSVNPKEER